MIELTAELSGTITDVYKRHHAFVVGFEKSKGLKFATIELDDEQWSQYVQSIRIGNDVEVRGRVRSFTYDAIIVYPSKRIIIYEKNPNNREDE